MKAKPAGNRLHVVAAKIPKWPTFAIGITIILLGALLLLKPFNSIMVMVALIGLALIVDGIAHLLQKGKGKPETAVRGLGVLFIAAGLIVVAAPSLSVQLVAITVGAGLMLSGSIDIFRTIKGSEDGRLTLAVKGVAVIIFGALALAWQDVALLFIAVAFSIKLMVTGTVLVAGALRGKRKAARAKHEAFGRVVHFAGACLLLLAAFGLLGLSHKFRVAAPTPDGFYAYDQPLPAEPGKLLRSEPYTQSMPRGVRGWRILYTTTTGQSDKTVLASAFVMAPPSRAVGPQPVIAWTHGTSGYARGCAPTVMPEPLPLGGIPAVQEVIDNGWVIVGTDYAGMGTKGVQPYLIGQGEARSTLDSVRATRQLKDLSLSNQTVVWGHSQGGGAALWTGSLAKSYAPDVPIAGVAAAAPATDLPALLNASKDSPVGKIMGSFALKAYSETYPDVHWNEYVKPSVNIMATKMAERCLAEKSTLVSALTSLALPGPIYRKDPTTGALGERIRQNIPTGMIDSPVFVAQGGADPLILPKVQAKYVAERCAAGQQIYYKTYAGKDHVSVVENNSVLNQDFQQWTRDRFAGLPAVGNCQ